ncbi:MAG: hypothetical protein IJ680_08875, partial [Paludibacteraceae bacterium]|nr:hypothetical protein [Paludibacteraceae bacterium]
MKKLLSLSLALLMGLQLFAVDFLVQTGVSTDAKWDASVATATGAVIVDLTTEGKAVNAWITDNAAGKEVWFAAGKYTFTAAATAKANWKLYGGFAGTETSVEARRVGANAWDMQNATIFDGGGAVQLFSSNAEGQTYDGLTMQNANLANHASVMRLGNNGIVNACRVVNNAATTANAQGSIQIYNGNATFKNSYFAGNEAGQGGALYLAVATQTVTVSDCRFENNFVHSTSTTPNSGGAIQIQGAGTVTVERSFFVGNRVDNAKNGAAISQANTNAATTIANNVITGSKGSPALYAVCGKIYNNTIANNEDGALNVNNGSNLIEIVNNVMFGSDAETTGKVNV